MNLMIAISGLNKSGMTCTVPVDHTIPIRPAEGSHSRIPLNEVDTTESEAPLFHINAANAEVPEEQTDAAVNMGGTYRNILSGKGLTEEAARSLASEESVPPNPPYLAVFRVFPLGDLLRIEPFTGSIFQDGSVQVQGVVGTSLVVELPIRAKLALGFGKVCNPGIGQQLFLHSAVRALAPPFWSADGGQGRAA